MSLRMEAELEKEIQELEQKVLGKKQESNPTNTVATEEKVEDIKESTEEVITLDTQETTQVSQDDAASLESSEEDLDEISEDTSETKQRTNWKKRFKSYKASTDSTIYKLRQDLIKYTEENLSLKKKIDSLSTEVDNLKSTSVSDGLTDEERELLGDDAVSSVSKMMDTRLKIIVDPLKQQLKEERDLRDKITKQSLEETQKSNHELFISRLKDLVPDCEVIDQNPKWLTWMKGIDEISGLSREYLFKQAVSIGNVREVAGYFKEFKSLSNPLEKKITPVQTSANSIPITTKSKEPKFISMTFVNQFYEDCIRGRYRGKEKIRQEIETEINKAIAEKRIVK